MGVKSWTKARLKKGLERYGYEIVRAEDLYEWQRVRADKPCWNDSPLPTEAAEYLRPDNPKLIELSKRYGAFDSEVTTPLVWTDGHVRPEDLTHFRAAITHGSGRSAAGMPTFSGTRLLSTT